MYYLHVYLHHMWAWPVKDRRGHLIPSGKLLTIVSHHVGARNWTQVLWKNSHLSSPIVSTFLEMPSRFFSWIWYNLCSSLQPSQSSVIIPSCLCVHVYVHLCLPTCMWRPEIRGIPHPTPVLFFWERISTELQISWNSWCRPSWPWIHRNPPASAS